MSVLPLQPTCQNNTDNPEVQDYLIRSAEMWTRKLHLDAWRLDVPDELAYFSVPSGEECV